MGFDNQLSALERTLAAKQRDYEELLLLSGDANHAREIAQSELDQVRAGYEEERERRETELRERHQLMQMRKQNVERAERRRKDREKIREDNEEGLDEEGERALRESLMVSDEVSRKANEAKMRIDIFENAFRKIKEATGVSDVNEVIAKILSQEGTTENLMALTKENQKRMELLNDQSVQVKTNLDSLKFSGAPGGHRRKLVDDQEDQLVTSVARLHRCTAKFERLNGTLISTKAGIQHILSKMLSVRDDFPALAMTEPGQPALKKQSSVVDITSDDHLITVLSNIMKASENMNRRVASHQIEMGVLGSSESVGSLMGSSISSAEDDETDPYLEEKSLSMSRPFNQRVLLPSGEEWDNPEEGVGEGGGGNDGDEEELTRHRVKQASEQMVKSVEKKKTKKKKSAPQ